MRGRQRLMRGAGAPLDRTEKTARAFYMDQTFGHEDRLLRLVREAAERDQLARMQIAPHEGRILQFLARAIGARKIVEIGTLYGYSALYLARALPDKGLLWTCDLSEERQQKARGLLKSSPDFKKIQWRAGPALETLPSLESEGPFDMVFIDADKGSYGKYLAWAERNLRAGGLAAADNTFLFGAVYGESARGGADPETLKAMKEFNKTLSESPQWTGALIPTAEGLTAAVKAG